MTAEPDQAMAISRRLTQLAEDVEGDAASMDWIMGQLHERAFGLFLLVLALPCCIPFLYGVPQIVALPLMFISAQMLLGRETPWLPRKLGARSMPRTSLANLAARAEPWLRRIEAVSRPQARLADARAAGPGRGTGAGAVQRLDPGAAARDQHRARLRRGDRRDGPAAARRHPRDPGRADRHVMDRDAGHFAGATLASLIRGWLGILKETVDRARPCGGRADA
jgi:hypothetical protein